MLLNLVIANDVYAAQESVFANLELIVKLIFYNPINLTKSSESFIKALLSHPTSTEFNRLGLFTLYLISLAL
jgi:hypothetical protein